MTLTVALLVAGGTSTARSQGSPLEARLAQEGVLLDLSAREVRVRGSVRRSRPSPDQPIEFLLVAPGGFTHETLAIIDCKPSSLNAAFVALGLTPGSSRRTVVPSPPPAEEDVRDGIEPPFEILPPLGPRVFLYASYTDADEVERFCPIEDLIVETRTGEPYPVRGFVYLGSRFAPLNLSGKEQEVFVADYEGNLVTIYPTRAAAENSLFDVYAKDPVAYQYADVNPQAGLVVDTPIEFLFTLTERPGVRPFEAEETTPSEWFPAPEELLGQTRNPYLAGADASWLQRIGPRRLKQLAFMLEYGHEEVRACVAGLLGSSRRESAVPALTTALRWDRSDDVRLAAAFALAEVGSRSSLAALVDVLGESWAGPRKDALFGLQLYSGKNFGLHQQAWTAWLEQTFPSTGSLPLER